MRIEGHRPYFDMGPGISPITPPQSPQRDQQAAPEAVTRVAKPTGTVASHARRPNEPPPLTEDTQKARHDAATERTDAQPRTATREQVDSELRERSLPTLSAEALATALMTAEPDKAVVPRVLPSSMVEDGGTT